MGSGEGRVASPRHAGRGTRDASSEGTKGTDTERLSYGRIRSEPR